MSMGESEKVIDHLIELRGVYDGWSIAAYTDGTFRNRWAEDDGSPTPGYERRWQATEEAIVAYAAPTPEPSA